MDKRVQKRLKRDALDKIMQENPKLNEFLETLTDEDTEKNPELQKIIQATIQDSLEKARMDGVMIGFSGAMVGAYKKIENCKTVDEAQKLLEEEANKVRKKMGLGTVEELINNESIEADAE